MLALLFPAMSVLALSACATKLPSVSEPSLTSLPMPASAARSPSLAPLAQSSSLTPVTATPDALAAKRQEYHYVGWFHNDRTRQSYPAVLQLEPTTADKPSERQANNLLHAVFRIFTPDNMILSSFYPNVQLRAGGEFVFPNSTEQKIRIVGKGTLQQENGSANLFAVIYGFGQGAVQLQKQAISSYALPATRSKYPLAMPELNISYNEFPQQAFVQQQQAPSKNRLLEDSKNILSVGLYSVDYKLRTKLGVYYGVLHHEYHNRFQYVRLEFSGGDQKNTLTTASTLFFSLPQKREFIVYRYANKITADNGLPTILSGEGDNFLKVSDWDRDKIEALWYSKAHGRIGRVYLQRNSFPQLPKGAQIISALTGKYTNASFACDIKVNNKVADDLSLYPSSVHGVVRDVAARKNYLISSGRYDFYRDNVEIFYNGKLLRYSLQQQDFAPTVISNRPH